MNNLKNNVRLIGYIGSNPEVKVTANGKKRATFTLATSEMQRSDSGRKVIDMQWHRLVAWNRQADIAERFLKRGSEIAIQGRLSSHSYTDAEGVKRTITEVVVTDLRMLGRAVRQEPAAA